MQHAKCKICRRAGVKLFLKGERCFLPKCAMIKKPYAPGEKSKKRRKNISEYGKELKEKQKLRNWYNLSEKQFRNYVKLSLGARSKVVDADVFLIKTLESRLDNVIFRLGFSPSRAMAKQLISHRHFLLNGRPVNTPSYLVKKGDRINIKPDEIKKVAFKDLSKNLKKFKAPSWLELDVEKLEGKIVGAPNLEEAAPPAEISAIFEFYSR